MSPCPLRSGSLISAGWSWFSLGQVGSWAKSIACFSQFLTYGSTPLLTACPRFCFSSSSSLLTPKIWRVALCYYTNSFATVETSVAWTLLQKCHLEELLFILQETSFSEAPGQEGMLDFTLVLCSFSGILRKNVVSDFVDCQNEARWQWIKFNAALLFLDSWLRFPVSNGALPAQQPQPHMSPAPHAPSHPVPLPMGSWKCCPGGEERWSFILVKTANWKLLTWHFSCLEYSSRACLPHSWSDKTQIFCNCSNWFACWNEVTGWAAEPVKPGLLQIFV